MHLWAWPTQAAARAARQSEMVACMPIGTSHVRYPPCRVFPSPPYEDADAGAVADADTVAVAGSRAGVRGPRFGGRGSRSLTLSLTLPLTLSLAFVGVTVGGAALVGVSGRRSRRYVVARGLHTRVEVWRVPANASPVSGCLLCPMSSFWPCCWARVGQAKVSRRWPPGSSAVAEGFGGSGA